MVAIYNYFDFTRENIMRASNNNTDAYTFIHVSCHKFCDGEKKFKVMSMLEPEACVMLHYCSVHVQIMHSACALNLFFSYFFKILMFIMVGQCRTIMLVKCIIYCYILYYTHTHIHIHTLLQKFFFENFDVPNQNVYE